MIIFSIDLAAKTAKLVQSQVILLFKVSHGHASQGLLVGKHLIQQNCRWIYVHAVGCQLLVEHIHVKQVHKIAVAQTFLPFWFQRWSQDGFVRRQWFFKMVDHAGNCFGIRLESLATFDYW